ncbi:MAG: hypothetical protein ABEH38_08910 [Flavobacteriales bacterium]
MIQLEASWHMKRGVLLTLSILSALAGIKAQDTARMEEGEGNSFLHTLSMGSTLPIMGSKPGLFLGGEAYWRVSYGLSDHFSATGGVGYIYHPAIELGDPLPKASLIPITVGAKASYPSRKSKDGNFYLTIGTGSYLTPWEKGLSPNWGLTISIGRASSGPITYGLRYRSYLNSLLPYRAVSAYIGYQL